MRCPFCKGLDTKRHTRKSRKRYFCQLCKKTFSFKKLKRWKNYRHSIKEVHNAIKRYIEGLSSFRIIAKQFQVSPASVYNWLFLIGKNCKDTIEVAKELKPKWTGYLSLDGKSIFIFGIEHVLLLACDIKTQDVVHIKLLPKEEYECFREFLRELKEHIEYPLKAVTIDLRRGLLKAFKNIFPKVPIQICVIHLSRQLDQRLPKGKKKSKFRKQNRELRKLIKSILFANTIEEAKMRLNLLKLKEQEYKTKAQRSVIKMTKRNFSLFTTHFSCPDLPRDNNIIENIIKQINRKLKLIGGFRNKESAWAIIKLLVMSYRFKSFTDCSDRNKHFNGKSPLEISGVNISNLDWLNYSQAPIT